MLLTNATLATMDPADATGFGLVRGGAVAVEADRIVWAGAMEALPDAWRGADVLDVAGRLITPGLIDCHTHIVHGGNRAAEFEQRLNGASYEQIARAGGGIGRVHCGERGIGQQHSISGCHGRSGALYV